MRSRDCRWFGRAACQGLVVLLLLAWAGCKTAPLNKSKISDAAHDGADVGFGVPDAAVVGAGGATFLSGMAGVGGGGGIGGVTGGPFGGGGQGSGGVTSTGGSVAPGTGGGISPGTGGSTSLGAGGTTGAVTVQLDRTKQTMDGFGINCTWAPAMSDSTADALFDAAKGIGLSILRFGIGSTGGPMTSNVYADIKKANARGVKTFVASILSAPSDCKEGEHLSQICYDTWASTLAAFPGTLKQETGADLYALSVQNEPDYTSNDTSSSMLYAAEEMVAFTKVLGPKLMTSSPAVKLIAPETTEWGRLWGNQSAPGAADPLNGKYDFGHALAADPDAWAQVDIVGTHMYETQIAEPWPGDVPQRKPVWMTEVCGIKGWPEAGPSSDIGNGVAVAEWIHDAITIGDASAWLWFWYKANYTDDNEGLILKNGTDTKRHYTLGNFSKFIRPGYVRVEVAGAIPADVLVTAYKGADGTVVVVGINKGGAPATLPISISGGAVPASVIPWVTSAADDLVAQTAISVSGGSFTATLAATTVTTFVGN